MRPTNVDDRTGPIESVEDRLAAIDDWLDRLEHEVDRRFEELDRRLERIDQRLQLLTDPSGRADFWTAIRTTYAPLDRRVNALEQQARRAASRPR